MLIVPDKFRRDPGGYFVNQFGHASAGVAMVFLGAVGWQEWAGEMPVKWALAAVLIGGYFLLIEMALQGWRGWDTAEDTVFFSYGVAMTLIIFSEARLGSGMVIGAPSDAMGVFTVFALHLMAGVAWRFYERARP